MRGDDHAVQHRRGYCHTSPESARGATCRRSPPAGKVWRIGYLIAGSGRIQEASRQGLRDLGYVEGQNLTIEYRHADAQLGRLPALAAELGRLPVDVLVTAGDNAARAAQQATRTIPIVLAAGGEPVGLGLVASLARPGGTSRGSPS